MPSSSGFLREVPQLPQPVGGGKDHAFFLNDKTINYNYTIPTGKNAGSFGPITVAGGVTVTVPAGSTWSIVNG
jgi:hypothetical protein